MADVRESGYLSIGEVLGLLLEEFPDITISKIRFLESQGLISPERTSSGYRKFYDEDVDLLRVILTEQRQNYLPLRVIKDRLETGEIVDPTGDHQRPDDDGTDDDGNDDHPTDVPTDVAVGANGAASDWHGGAPMTDDVDTTDGAERTDVPASSIASHPAGRNGAPGHPEAGDDATVAPESPAAPSTAATADGVDDAPSADESTPTDRAATDSAEPEPDSDDAGPHAATHLLPGVLLDREELCSMVGMSDHELAELESFGIVSARDGSVGELYGEDAVEIAKPASAFLRLGIDARHLRNWKTAAEREASLYEQLVAPRFRQRNPQARNEALNQLRELDALGGTLRAAMTRHALRHHFES